MFSKILKNSFLSKYLLLVSKESLIETRVEASDTTLIFYYGPKFNDSKRYKLSEAAQIVKNPFFKKGETHLYLHGWKESQDSSNIHVTVDAYFKRKDINLITVDWARAALQHYSEVCFTNMQLLAPILADAVLDLYNGGVDRKDLRIVGHSLGAQLAGMIGRQIIRKSHGKIQIYRMDLLDAAYPLFTPDLLGTVNKNDAEFVQAIHTAAGTCGQPLPIGHVDFFPNTGSGQPGCTNGIVGPFSDEDMRSHGRSWQYWAESVANVNGTNSKFLALPLRCSDTDMKPVEMGINCPMSAWGSNFLKTNSKSLFAKGMDGLYKL